jgi:CO dehydrogenase/acetyl-CoA synthase beta subunit
MPSQLKEELKTRLIKKLADQNKSDLFDKIADETSATSLEDLISCLERIQHPALTMKPLV